MTVIASVADILLTLVDALSDLLNALVPLLPGIGVPLGLKCVAGPASISVGRLPTALRAIELLTVIHLLARLRLLVAARSIIYRPVVGTFRARVAVPLLTLLAHLLTIVLGLLAIVLRVLAIALLLLVGPIVGTRNRGRCCGPSQQQTY